MKICLIVPIIAVILLLSPFTRADNVSPVHSNVITLVAAPRGTKVDETAMYQPIADYLSQQIGRPVHYVFIGDWLSYRAAIRSNAYDLYFNGPHFVAWLVDYRQQRLVARLVESHTFVAIAKSDNAHINRIEDLSGRKACLHAPPNLGTLIFNSAFTNPARQPYTIVIEGWKAAFNGVVHGQCEGGVLPEVVLKKLNTSNQVKIVHRFPAIANQAITANDRLTAPVIDAITTAMLAPAADVVAAKLLSVYASKGFVEARPADYAGLGIFLKDDFLLGQEIELHGLNPDTARYTGTTDNDVKPDVLKKTK